jgi:integrase
MGRIYQRGERGTYWGDYVHPATGKRYQRSLKTRDKAVAKERLRQWELAAIPEARGRKQRLSEAVANLIQTLHDKAEGTIEMYMQKGARLSKTLGDPFVGDITLDMVQDYISQRLAAPAKPHTIAKELIVLRRTLKHAHKRGILAAIPPLPDYSPKYKPRETWLTAEQFAALQKQLEPHRQRWTGLATYAGGSAGEVERVRWEEVKFKDGVLRMPGTKRETRDRWVPIAPAMYALLDGVPKRERTGPVVQPWPNVRRDLHAACDRAGIPHVSPNDLRRTFASWLVQHGVDLFTVSKLMGHSSTRMVERVYGKLTRENMQAALARVPQLGVPQVSQTSARLGVISVAPGPLLPPGEKS